MADENNAETKGWAKFHHVSVTTANLDVSLHFYRDLLELPLIAEGTAGSPELDAITGLSNVKFRWAELEIGPAGILELIEYVNPRGQHTRSIPCDPGFTHFAIAVEHIDAVLIRLSRAGAIPKTDPVVLRSGEWRGAQVVYVRDPDGATVELIQFP